MKRYYEVTYWNENRNKFEHQIFVSSSFTSFFEYINEFFDDTNISFHSICLVVPEVVD